MFSDSVIDHIMFYIALALSDPTLFASIKEFLNNGFPDAFHHFAIGAGPSIVKRIKNCCDERSLLYNYNNPTNKDGDSTSYGTACSVAAFYRSVCKNEDGNLEGRVSANATGEEFVLAVYDFLILVTYDERTLEIVKQQREVNRDGSLAAMMEFQIKYGDNMPETHLSDDKVQLFFALFGISSVSISAAGEEISCMACLGCPLARENFGLDQKSIANMVAFDFWTGDMGNHFRYLRMDIESVLGILGSFISNDEINSMRRILDSKISEPISSLDVFQL